MKTAIAILVALLLFVPGMAHATVIGSASITTQGQFTLQPGDVLTLTVAVTSCGAGQLPLYNGQPISITPNQTPSSPFTADGTETVTFVVPGNDKIVCGSQSYSLYALTWRINGFSAAPTVLYRFVDNTTSNLTQLVPISFTPPILNNAAGKTCPAITPLLLGFTSTYYPVCAAAVTNLTPALPITGGTMQGSIVIPNPYTLTDYSSTTQLVNGIPMADQFSGADFCGKLLTAMQYAITNHIGIVDATHFSSTQSCASDPFHLLGGTAGAHVSLMVLLPAAVISQSVGIQMDDSGMILQGAGRGNTVFAYTGTSNAWVVGGDSGSNYTQFSDFRDFSVVTTAASGASGADFIIANAHRNRFSNMSFWGNVYGLDTQGAVTDTFDKIHVSNEDAAYFGWSGYQQPTRGIVLGSGSGNQTTDGTFTDVAVEDVSGIGIELTGASNMVFNAGTSEENLQGIQVDSGSKWNNFIGMDIEGNSLGTAGVDVTDNGQSNNYIGTLATSTCSACSGVLAGGSGGQNWVGDGNAQALSGTWNTLNNNPNFKNNSGTTQAYVLDADQVAVSLNFFAAIMSSTGTLPSCTAGTGITSCTVTTGSTESRGFAHIVNSSATTNQVLATLHWGATLNATPWCSVTQAGGSAWLALYTGTVSTTVAQIENTNSVSGVTDIYFSYQCQE